MFILLLIIAQIVPTRPIETTLPVPIVLDGFTLQSWNEQSMWNQTRTTIVYHLNHICKKDIHCDAEYGVDNIHLLNVISYGLSSIYLNITADKPILNKLVDQTVYNYTALLTTALFQSKIDIEHLHDNQLLTRINNSSFYADQNSIVNRTSRLLFVLLGITLVAIIFSLTIVFIQKINKHTYSKLFMTTRTSQPVQDELLNNSTSTAVLHS